MSGVSIRRVAKSFGDVKVIHDLSIDIRDGEFLVFVGPSGCGKSTLLRMVAGLEGFQSGEIAIGDRVVNQLPARDRDVAMVFQDYALYPHMTVRNNLGFGLKMREFERVEIDRRVDDAARILQIEHLLQRRPRELSGGQRQRVAMGRAMVRNPKVFLFDEPLSNLDAKLRVDMRTEIKSLHQRLKTTSIYVTHDQVEAMTMADRIVVLDAGHILQVGTPLQLYHDPQTRFVAGFLGAPAMNFLPVQITDGRLTLPGGGVLSVAGKRSGSAELGIRPERLRVEVNTGIGSNTGITSYTNVTFAKQHTARLDTAQLDTARLATTVETVEPLGADTLVFSRCGEHRIVSRLPGDAVIAPGEKLNLLIDVEHVLLFDANSGERL